jgi:hypothetical protein
MFTVLAAAPTPTILWGDLLNTTVGILFSLVIGFFILEFILGALNLATDYSNKDALENAKKTFTSAIKGLVISLGAIIIMNSILPALGLSAISNPAETLATQLTNLENCIRDYSSCRP